MSDKVDRFIEEAKKFFNLHGGNESPLLETSEEFSKLIDNLFICNFLYDCILKGIDLHKKSLQQKDIKELAKKIDPKEAQRIPQDFGNLMEHKELISILAYEFFINYIYGVLVNVYKRHIEFLKDIGKIEYKGHEIIDKIRKHTNFIEDLINLKIFGTKEQGSLKTKPDFWIKLLESIKVEIPEEHIVFWKAFHTRRNASSHVEAKQRWIEIKSQLRNGDLRIWFYGLLYVAYKIDEQICDNYGFKSKEVTLALSGEPFYDMEKIES